VSTLDALGIPHRANSGSLSWTIPHSALPVRERICDHRDWELCAIPEWLPVVCPDPELDLLCLGNPEVSQEDEALVLGGSYAGLYSTIFHLVTLAHKRLSGEVVDLRTTETLLSKSML
jgi:hypothetical protein